MCLYTIAVVDDDLVQNLEDLTLTRGLVTLSQKSAPQLNFNGFYFRASNAGQHGTFQWRCIKTDSKCKAKCTTHGNNVGSTYDVQAAYDVHSHAPDTVTISKLEKRRRFSVSYLEFL